MFSPWGYTGVKGVITPLNQLCGLQHRLLGLFAHVELSPLGTVDFHLYEEKNPVKTVLPDEAQDLLFV